jgi:hypothetical protein
MLRLLGKLSFKTDVLLEDAATVEKATLQDNHQVED